MHANIYEWPTVKRAVFMADNGRGCVIVEIPKGKKPYLYNLNVMPDCRKGGIATTLMDAAEDWAREQGADCITLAWSLSEAPYWVFDWYVRRGYDEKEIGSKCALMEKRL